MQALECAVIGTGWCGGIRSETLARSALCAKLHICEIRPDRLAEVKALTSPATATLDYQDIVKNDNVSVNLFRDPVNSDARRMDSCGNSHTLIRP